MARQRDKDVKRLEQRAQLVSGGHADLVAIVRGKPGAYERWGGHDEGGAEIWEPYRPGPHTVLFYCAPDTSDQELPEESLPRSFTGQDTPISELLDGPPDLPFMAHGPRVLDFTADGHLDAGLVSEPQQRRRYIREGTAHIKTWWHGSVAESARLEADSRIVEFGSSAGEGWRQVLETPRLARKLFRSLPHDRSADRHIRRNQALNKALAEGQRRQINDFSPDVRRFWRFPAPIKKDTRSGTGRYITTW